MKWFKPEPTILFASNEVGAHVSPITAVKPANQFKPEWLVHQRGYENSRDRFENCPGMHDWMVHGYIIPAYTDIHIKANVAGTHVKVDAPLKNPPGQMSNLVTAGLPPIEPSVKHEALKIPMPWAIFTKTGYSAHVLPAIYHSPFLRDLYVYPGIVDFDVFHTINFVFTPLRECEIFIQAGTPLLQVIPFKREKVTAVCRKVTENEHDRLRFGYPTKVRAAYRKFFHKRKSFKMIGE